MTEPRDAMSVSKGHAVEKDTPRRWRCEVTFVLTAEGETATSAWDSVRHWFPSGDREVQMTDLRISVLPPGQGDRS